MFATPRPPPASRSSSSRLSVASPTGEAGARIARWGGRFFVTRGAGSTERADRIVAMPDARGPLSVLVPRGYGHPLLARRALGGFRAEPAGEPCTPERWAFAGEVAAWLRKVTVPQGPNPVVERDGAGLEGQPLWLCVRPSSLDWAAVRREDASAGRGPVAVVDRWVRGVSPAARSRGVRRGMSVALARRHCPDLRIVAPRPVDAAREKLVATLTRDFGEVEQRRGAFLVRMTPAAAGPVGALAGAERLALRLWQVVGVEVRIAVAETAADALGLARVIDPGWVAAVPVGASGSWSVRRAPVGRWVRGGGGAEWTGAAVPDIEGAVEICRGLAAPLVAEQGGGTLSVSIVGSRGTVKLSRVLPKGIDRAALNALIDGAVRAPLLTAGAVTEVKLTVGPSGEQRVPPVRPSHLHTAILQGPILAGPILPTPIVTAPIGQGVAANREPLLEVEEEEEEEEEEPGIPPFGLALPQPRTADRGGSHRSGRASRLGEGGGPPTRQLALLTDMR